MTRRVNILFFAVAREVTGTHAIKIDFEGHCAKELIIHLVTLYPGLGSVFDTAVLSINGVYCGSPDTDIPENSTVAVIPPISGG